MSAKSFLRAGANGRARARAKDNAFGLATVSASGLSAFRIPPGSPLLYLSCQAHTGGSGDCRCGDVGCVNWLLVAVDVELQGGSVGADVDGDIGTHHEGQVH